VCKVLGYRWDAYEHGSILATGVTPVSLWPLVIGSNIGVVMLRCRLGLDDFSVSKPCC
jgi:hypothetical protein